MQKNVCKNRKIFRLIDKLNSINKILIVNFGGIGDLLLSTPALRSLHNLYPDSYIALLTVSNSADILKGLAYLDDIFIFDFKTTEVRGFKIFFKLKDLIGKFKILLNLRKKKFDIVINMRTIVGLKGAIKMWFIFAMIGANLKAGRDTDGLGFFLNIKTPEKYKGEIHETDYDLNLVKLLWRPSPNVQNNGTVPFFGDCPIIFSRDLDICISKEDEKFVDKFLKENNIKENDVIIGVNPGSGWPSKRLDIEKFAGFIKLLKNNIIVITGTKEEEKLAFRLKELTNENLIIAAGKTTIKQLVCLIKRFACFITNDSGPMHIASACLIPIVAIFGPGDVVRFRPLGENVTVLYKQVECSPCNYVICPKKDFMKCLQTITPQEMLDVTLNLLKINNEHKKSIS